MSLLRKGAITRRGGLPTFKPTGLAPQKVVDVDGVGDPTRDTYQRKVFYDATNFFVVYWESDDKQVKYVASADGETWTSATVLWTFGVGPYYGANVDIQYPNKGEVDLSENPYDLSMTFSGSNGNAWYVSPLSIVGQTLSEQSGSTLITVAAQGGAIIASLNGTEEYWVFHRAAYLVVGLWATERATTTEVSYGGATTGGAQILPYKTSSPYYMFILAKGGDDKLYYARVDEDGTPYLDAFTSMATLGTGFSDFCGASEAQAIGDPEKIHIVYIKSSGELCYRKYENDAMGSEKVLVSSGASYPVIACGSNGKLYVFYVKNGKIWVIHNNGNWLKPVELFTDDHTYDTPTYLSCNQNVQSGKICLVWCEGTSSPYEVWFCYLED